MDEDDIQRLEAIYDFLSQPQWTEIVKELSDLWQQTNNVYSITDVDKLHYCRGRLATLQEMINLKESIGAQLDDAKADSV